MLEIRNCCEHCGKDLPNTSKEAMICSFECTYCMDCAQTLFLNVCPSCGGNFERRPIRPAAMLLKYPVSQLKVFAPKDSEVIKTQIKKYKNLAPDKR